MLEILQHNKYNYILHSPNQTGVGSYQVWRETLKSPSQPVDPKHLAERNGLMQTVTWHTSSHSPNFPPQPTCAWGLHRSQ